MEDISLKIQPENVADVARKLVSIKKSMLATINSQNSSRKKLNAIWESESQEDYMRECEKLKEHNDAVIKVVDGYVATLNQVSGIFVSAETEATIRSEGLPTQGVFR